jgi:hypothetical protein
MGNKKRPVITSPEEARLVAEAEQAANFGQTTAFNPQQEIDDMVNAGIPVPPAIALQKPLGQQGAPVQAPSQEEEEKEEESKELSKDPATACKQLSEAISEIHPNPPSPEQLFQWKQVHGNIYYVEVEQLIFVFRYMKRQEWAQIQADPSFQNMTETQVQNALFDRFVLWSSVDPIQRGAMPANAIGMVVEQIRIRSLFLSPEYVSQLVIKI